MPSTLTNPFTPAQPAPASMFVGRRREVQLFRQSLRQTAAGGSAHLLVTGQRGIGKSSFANYLASLATNSTEQIPFTVFQLSVSEHQSSQELIRALATALRSYACVKRPYYRLLGAARSIGQLAVGPFQISRKEGIEPSVGEFESVLTWLCRCSRSLGNQAVICVLIDELDRLTDLGRFAQLLKGLVESPLFTAQRPRPLLQLLLVGMPSAREQIYAGHSSIMRALTPITLDTLTELEAAELVQTALAGGDMEVSITETALDLIVHWSDCYPFLLQHLGYSCFEVDRDGTIGEDDFIAGMIGNQEFPGSIALLREQLFDEMARKIVETPVARQALFRLIELSEEGVSYIEESKLLVTGELSAKDVERSIETMIDHGLVERHPLYKEQIRIASRMLWIYLKILRNREQLPNNILDILSVAPKAAEARRKSSGQVVGQSDSVKERKEVTIIFGDIEGSTSLGSELGPEDFLELTHEILDHLSRCINKYAGKVVNFMGDGVFATFEDEIGGEEDHSIRAVRAAVCMLDEVERLSQRRNSHVNRLHVRIGLNRGILIVEGDGYFGSALNVAARVSALPDPGKIYMTAVVAEHCQSLFPLESIGTRMLKGLGTGVELFQIRVR